MEFNDGNNVDNEMWEWQEGEYNLHVNSHTDITQYLLDEINETEDNFLDLLDVNTPIKDCVDFGCPSSEIDDNNNKWIEECRESSQLKRRRMLQFTSDPNGIDIDNEQTMPGILKSKAREDSLMEDIPLENLQWDSQWNLEFQDDRCSSGFEEFDQSNKEWLLNCLSESETPCNPDEMNDHMESDARLDNSSHQSYSSPFKLYDTFPEIVNNVVPEDHPSGLPKVLRGRKSVIKIRRKLTTSVAYPFALIKPCEVQGDVTLKDINQRLHAPPPSRSRHVKEDNPHFPYATSAFSGKPVVVKTKIHTDGGKGSITIMRTKG